MTGVDWLFRKRKCTVEPMSTAGRITTRSFASEKLGAPAERGSWISRI